MLRTRVASVLIASSLVGCSSEYIPQGPRVGVVMDGGQITYVREGKKYPHGFAGGGLVDAVEGVPEAEEAAKTYRNRLIGGVSTSAASILCLIAAPITLAGRDNSQGLGPAFTGSLLCALALSGVSVGLLASAQPYQFDAINLYNASIDRRSPMLPPGYPPPYAYPPPYGFPPAMPPGASTPYLPPTPPAPPAPSAPRP